MMWARTALALCLVAALAGCSGYRPPKSGFYELLSEPYRLDAGDRLRVTVYDQPNLSNTYLVDPSGQISMPLIGAVTARGVALKEIEKDIAVKLSRNYLRHPDVSVEIDQYRPFFIMGEVHSAGQYPYVPGMTAQNAVAIAGGFTPRARQADVDVTRQINGEVMTGHVPMSAPLRPGDTVYVRERLF